MIDGAPPGRFNKGDDLDRHADVERRLFGLEHLHDLLEQLAVNVTLLADPQRRGAAGAT
jgi:hypothetical protein